MKYERVPDQYDLHTLVGKTIKTLQINADKTDLLLVCEEGEFLLRTRGDCCSESWIEHMSGVEDVSGCTIEYIDTVDLGEAMPTRQESDELYGVKFKLKASNGRARWSSEMFLEFRNSSNGYYGGWIEVVPGGPSTEPTTALLEDF